MGHPTWGYHPTEDARIFEDGELPEGWYDSPAKCPGDVPPETNGGTNENEAETEALAAKYQAAFGKPPHHRMKPETIRQHLAEAQNHGDGKHDNSQSLQPPA